MCFYEHGKTILSFKATNALELIDEINTASVRAVFAAFSNSE